MKAEEKLRNVAVLGAAGKMGSGITMLTALEMASQSVLPQNRGQQYILYAIDVNNENLAGLLKYIESQALKYAEKNTVYLRKVYADRADLVENEEIIREYVKHVLSIVRPVNRIENAASVNLVFEAASENPELKVQLFRQIEKVNPHKPWYLTNTSSIPISWLEKEAGLEGRLIGFHFYNPPAVQKLIEIIPSAGTSAELREFALEFAQTLKKVIVFSNDKAGFIGNGHFMRDILFATSQVEKLTAKGMPETQAIYLLNKVSHELLVRPMGIFQLVDYVGIDVCQYIMKVMNPHYPNEKLHSDLLDRMLAVGVKGGQYPDGSQKDGFFKYEKGRIVGIFDLNSRSYLSVDELENAVRQWGAPWPEGAPQWKTAIKISDASNTLKPYFDSLKGHASAAARLAIEYGRASRDIARALVSTGVALSEEDVNTVLKTGFYHVYGPVNAYFD
ncbi:MAG: 3-hydroxyacyl-CoA dehydrogenase family protein [Bacteroidales bacterium]